jgi:hypothetical protein
MAVKIKQKPRGWETFGEKSVAKSRLPKAKRLGNLWRLVKVIDINF